MGTSHEEPMMRSTPVEWDLFGSGIWDYESNAENIYAYWVNGTERSKTYENVFTVGMRGAGAYTSKSRYNETVLQAERERETHQTARNGHTARISCRACRRR